MEHLFAVRVLLHYYDKSKVDHAAVRRLLSAAAVNHQPLLLSDGSTVSLSTLIDTAPASRKPIVDVVHSSGSTLVQVASVFMLAEARAAADAICTSPNELESACLALERLLGCLITRPCDLPVRDITLSARLKLGSTARRRALQRLSLSQQAQQPQQQTPAASHSSILKAVNAVLRLCDVATHCLAVVSRQCLSPQSTCQVAVNLSMRLLTLAASLHEVQRIDASPSSPALSFFSSNSLRTSLVSGAMHLGTISIEHLTIDPMPWIHVANHIATTSVTAVPQRTSVMSALFGGMIKGGRLYESCERDAKATERALLLLSTLHVVLETDVSSSLQSHSHQPGPGHSTSSATNSTTSAAPSVSLSTASSDNNNNNNISSNSNNNNSSAVIDIASLKQSSSSSPTGTNTGAGPISQAARSFLGERVVAAEEDGDEGRIAARTVYQACEEYAQRCEEMEGVMGMLCRLFEAAGRQCRLESAEETIVSLSDSILHLACPPDESDASSDGIHARMEGLPFHVDVFDQRMKDGFGPMAGMSSGVEDSMESAERLKTHRQIGALALETLAHWVHRSTIIQRYADIDMGQFAIRICMSASLFTIGESSSSYDLRAAMTDFGMVLAPVIDQTFAQLTPDDRVDKWKSLVSTLTQSCHTLNPILSNILNSSRNDGVVLSLLKSLLDLEDEQPEMAVTSEDFHGLPTESLLQLMFKAITRDSALLIVTQVLDHLARKADVDCYDVHVLNFRTACFTILGFAIFSYLGISEKVSHLVLQSLTGLYTLDVDHSPLFDLPQNINLLQSAVRQSYKPSPSIRYDARKLFNLLKPLPSIMRSVAFLSNVVNNLSHGLQIQYAPPMRSVGDSYTSNRPRAGFNLLWALIMTHHALTSVEKASAMSFPPQQTNISEDNDVLSSTSLFVQRENMTTSSVQLAQVFSSQAESPVTKMFVAETMSVLHFQSLYPGTSCDVLSLLTTMVKNTTDILSIATSEDWNTNLAKLHTAFRTGFSFESISNTTECQQPYISLSDGKGPLNVSGAQLAMGYIQKMGNDKVSDVLTHVIRTSTHILDALPSAQIHEGKHLIFDVLKTLPFIHESFQDLSPQLFLFVSKYLRMAFPECDRTSKGINAMIDFTARACGLSGVVECATSSSTGIQAFCKFASTIAGDTDIDVKALQSSFHTGDISHFGGSISTWLRSSLPRVSLDELFLTLLVSKEESAVTVSAYSQALSSLNEACERSPIWRLAILRSLHTLAFSEDSNVFFDRMVEGPIIHSATLHDGVISLFETVLAPGDSLSKADSQKCVSLLLKCMSAVNSLFEKDALSSFECRSRLINFALCLMLMSAVVNIEDIAEGMQHPEKTFESWLLSIIFAQLKLSLSALQEKGSDEAWKQTILSLCLLLDAFQTGLSDDHASVFNLIEQPDAAATLKKSPKANSTSEPESKDDTPTPPTTGSSKRPITSSPSSISSSVSEPPSNSKLCTYTQTGEQYVEQHWYFCYTCGLFGSDGVCSICARVCHKDCELAYSKFSRFFCDCGHGCATGNDGSSIQTSPDNHSSTHSNNQTSSTHKSRSSTSKVRKPCICLKHPIPEEPKPKAPAPVLSTPIIPHPPHRFERQLEACSVLRKKLCAKLKEVRGGNASQVMQQRFQSINQTFSERLQEQQSIKCLLDVAIFLIKDLDGCEIKTHAECLWLPLEDASGFLQEKFTHEDFAKLPSTGEKARSHKVIKSAAFDIPSSSTDDSSHTKHGSRISYSPFNKVAAVSVAAGSIEFVDMTSPLLTGDAPADKVAASMYGSTSTSFVPKHVSFHPENPNIVLVYDENHVSVLYHELEDNTWRELEIEIGLSGFDGQVGQNGFVSASWVEGEPSLILITSKRFIKIFDVAADTFCPCFYSQTPDCEIPDSSGSAKANAATIISASVISNPSVSVGERDFAVLLMRSDGALFLARTKTNESTPPSFRYCFSVPGTAFLPQIHSAGIIQMYYLRQQSSLCVLFNDGSFLLMSLFLNFSHDDILLGLLHAHLYRNAIPGGSGVEVEALPGPSLRLFFYQNSGSLSNCGILTVNSAQEINTSFLSGNSSSSVLGLSHFPASKSNDGPLQDGAFVLLNDGSVHRVYAPDGPLRTQSFEASTVSDIVERRARRGMRISEATCNVDDDYRCYPDPIGFFEKSRMVSEHLTVEGSGSGEDDGINYERMGVVLAGESGDSMVSTRENQSLKFSVSFNNKSLVLVGLRIRVGGVERSRNRVPTEVKVFGRLARTLPNNGVKRWIDIPLSVSESIVSPQRVLIELVPRLSSTETNSDGMVAVDCLELHAVSNEEFAERKVAYEADRTKHEELLKQKREKMKKENGQDPFAIISARETAQVQFNPEQAATLAVLHFAKRRPTQLERGRILAEVNSFWSLTFENSSSQNPTFLQQLMRSCLELMNTPEENKLETSVPTEISKSTISLLSEGTVTVVEDEVIGPIHGGTFPSAIVLEKCLLSLSSLCRSLFRLGCIEGMSPTAWFEKFDTVMPSFDSVETLLRQHLYIGRRGRLLYKSMKRACLSAVDIAFFHCVRESNMDCGKNLFVSTLIDMLCGHDQYLRLATSQRLLELFDSLDGLTNFIGSPLEINGLSHESDNSAASSDSAHGNETLKRIEDPDATQSWAYRCDSCGEVCDQEWWHCNDCEDFDLCTNCLRAMNIPPDSSHEPHHILLRGTLEDESNDQNESETPVDVMSLVATVQQTVQNITNEVLDKMIKCTIEQKWRFLDAAETMVQLLGPRSPFELRELRLVSLFNSAFPTMIQKQTEILISDFSSSEKSSSGHISTNTSSPGPAIALLLLLRILICSKGATMPIQIHHHSIPRLLVQLLSSLHGRLRSFINDLDKVNDSSTEQWAYSVMDEVVWNDEIPDLSYQLMTFNCGSKPSKPFSMNFESLTEGIHTLESLLILILEVLRVLDYSYRSASSSWITEEMEKIHRIILCDIINFCEVSASQPTKSLLMMEVSTEATNFISTLSFDNTDTFNDILDKNLYEEQVQRLRKAISEDLSSGFISYKPSVDIADILESLHKAAHRQPETWRTFANQKERVVMDMFQVAKLFDGEIQVRALQLLAVALSVSPELCPRIIRGLPISSIDLADQLMLKGDGGSDSASRPSRTDSESLKDCWTISELLNVERDQQSDLENLFSSNNFEMLEFLLGKVMLRSQNATSRRAAAHITVFGLSIASSSNDPTAFLRAISDSLLNGLEMMQFSGEIADGLMHCLRFFIACCQQNSFGSLSATLLSSLTVKTMKLLKDRCSVLVSHPNARLYCRLSEVLKLSGYYLESEPCMACATAAWESSGLRDFRLDMVRAETKYTDCSIMHRLISPHEIHSVSVKVVDPRRTRRPNRIDVYYSMRNVSDAADLKHPDHPWQKLKSLPLGPHRTESSVSLTVPVAIANIKLEFVEIHSFYVPPPPNTTSEGQSNSASSGSSRRSGGNRTGETLQCPRCSRIVTDRHGICRNCHENAYQCRQCRNINYENLDGFLCNECGYCKHGRFEFSVSGRATHVAEPIQNEDGRRRASKIIEKETNSVHRCMEQLSRIRSSMIKSLVQGVSGDESIQQRSKIYANTRIGLADLLDSMSPRPEIAVIEALLEGQVGQEIEEASQGTQGLNVTEEVLAEGSSTDANEREHSHRSGSNIASSVNRSSRSDAAQKTSNESHGFNKTITAIASTYSKECKTIFTTLSRGIRVLSITRAELVRYANRVGGNRLFDVSQETEAEKVMEIIEDENVQEIEDLVKNVRTLSCCYRCTQSFIANSLQILESILSQDGPCSGLIRSSNLANSLILVCSLCEKFEIQSDIRNIITLMVYDNLPSTQLVSEGLERKIGFCIDSYETVDAHSIARFEMSVLESTATLDDSCWEERLKLVIRILFRASKEALTCSSVAESIILPCLRVALRLTRSDSELTVIESRSPVDAMVDGSVSIAASREQPDTSETENDDVDSSSGPVTQIVQENMDGDVSVRLRMLQSNFVGMFGSDVNESASTSMLNTGSSSVFRDIARSEERRSQQRQGSDLMASSRAPSSIGTAFDGHVSDEDMEVPQDRLDLQINMNSVQAIIEKDHDGKRVNASIGQWLEGRQTHSSWISDMFERSKEVEEKERSLTSSEGILSGCPSLRTIFLKWQEVGNGNPNDLSQDPFSEMLSISNSNWIVRLMLLTPCTAVRKEACALLELVCGQDEVLQLQLLDLLSGPSLQLSANVGEKSKEFFDLLESSLSSKNHRLYLIGKGFLPHLAGLILAKAEQLVLLEVEADSSIRIVNFMEGYSLKRLVSLMRLGLGVIPSKRPTLREKLLERDNNKIVKCLQRAYLYVRKLISLKTRLTDECALNLGEVLLSKEFLFAGSTVTAIVSACVMELKTANRRNDAQGGAILLEELCQMLCPERREPTCLLTLNKTPTQEEFMRGNMTRNPYSSTSFDGPLMRDVKNKICRDMDLPGLLEDDFGMELLVAGNVVKLDLPIMAVYEHVWRGSAAAQAASSQPTHLSRSLALRRPQSSGSRGNFTNTRAENTRGALLSIRRMTSERDDSEDSSRSEVRPDPPVVVVYRLSGLDGEATEPIIDSLPVARDDEQSSEELYRDTVVLGRVGGFDVLFQLLAVVGSWGDDAETAVRAPALRLLRASCEVSQNRAMLAKSPNAVSTLLDCAASAFEHAQGSPAAVASAESLLIAAEQILAQQRRDMDREPNVQQGTVSITSQDPGEVTSRVEVFLGRLEKATSPTAEYSILHLLPFLIQGLKSAIDLVLEHLHFSWSSIDHTGDDQRKVKQLGTVLFATPKDLRGNAFITETIRGGIAQKAIDYVISKFPLPKKDNSGRWEDSLEDDGVPLVLKVLTGLSMFLDCIEGESARMLKEIIMMKGDVIPVLCQLEMAVSDKSVGTFAEELLEGLSRNITIESEINKERAVIKKARRDAALASRAAILQQSGLSPFSRDAGGTSSKGKVGGESSVGGEELQKKDSLQDSDLAMMDDLPDEVGPACVVCGDGFRCRPEEALTMYVFCKKIPIELSSKNNGDSTASSGPSKPRERTPTNNSTSRMDWEVWTSARSRNNGNSGTGSGSGNQSVGGTSGGTNNGSSSSRSSSSWCFTSVTHMSAIHLACHREAARVDRGSRRDEWDGASLRNSQTRCNNLLPVRPPITVMEDNEIEDKKIQSQALTSYSSAVDGYFSRLSGVGRTNLTKTKIMLYDIGRSLLRFSDGGTAIFAEHSKGGGAHSNACLLPHMVQLAVYLIENDGDGEANLVTQNAALTTCLDEGEVGDITYYLATSIILHDISKWTRYLAKFLGRCLDDGVIERQQVLRLIAFSDLVNRALKKGVTLDESDVHWLNKLGKHLSSDERFSLQFGDLVNEQWEKYVRHVQTTDDFMQALEHNVLVTEGQADHPMTNMDQIDLVLRGNP